jgi:hypothetical protein
MSAQALRSSGLPADVISSLIETKNVAQSAQKTAYEANTSVSELSSTISTTGLISFDPDELTGAITTNAADISTLGSTLSEMALSVAASKAWINDYYAQQSYNASRPTFIGGNKSFVAGPGVGLVVGGVMQLSSYAQSWHPVTRPQGGLTFNGNLSAPLEFDLPAEPEGISDTFPSPWTRSGTGLANNHGSPGDVTQFLVVYDINIVIRRLYRDTYGVLNDSAETLIYALSGINKTNSIDIDLLIGGVVVHTQNINQLAAASYTQKYRFLHSAIYPIAHGDVVDIAIRPISGTFWSNGSANNSSNSTGFECTHGSSTLKISLPLADLPIPAS